MGLVPKPLEINRLGRVWGGQSLGFGGRGTQKRAAREEGGKLGEVGWEGVRSQGLERAHRICNQVLVSTLLHPFICSSRAEKNEGGGS